MNKYKTKLPEWMYFYIIPQYTLRIPRAGIYDGSELKERKNSLDEKEKSDKNTTRKNINLSPSPVTYP